MSKFKICTIMGIVFFILTIFFIIPALAVPELINYQGKLTDTSGVVLTGDYLLSFSLYDADIDGTLLWSEEQTIAVQDGIFNVTLGMNNPIDISAISSDLLYLQLAVKNSDTANWEIMNERQRITSVCFALQAENAEKLNGHTAAELDQSDFVIRTDNPHHVTATQVGAVTLSDITWSNLSGIPASISDGDDVGITTETDPTVPASLKDGISWSEVTGIPEGLSDGIDNNSGGDITGVTAGSGLTGGGTYGNVTLGLQAPLNLTGDLIVMGNLGIGLSTPDKKLYILDDYAGLTFPLKIENKAAGDEPGESDAGILFSSGGSGDNNRGKGALVYETTATWNRGSFHFLQDHVANSANPDMADSVMTITNAGNVGIGNTSPQYALDVKGSVHAEISGIKINSVNSAVYGETNTDSLLPNYGGYFTASGGHGSGVYGKSTTGTGVYGEATDKKGIGVYGKATGSGSKAGYFYGNVDIDGYLDAYSLNADTLNLKSGADRSILLTDDTKTLFIGGKTPDDEVPWGIRSESKSYIGFATNGQDRLRIDGNGNVGIGTTSPAYKLQVMGQIAVQSIYLSSDIRLKKNIVPIENALDKVARLRGVEFQWNDALYENEDDKIEMGLIAQEVEQVVPEVVSDNEQGYKSVEYANLVSLLIEAVKDLKAQNEELRDRIMCLEDKTE